MATFATVKAPVQQYGSFRLAVLCLRFCSVELRPAGQPPRRGTPSTRARTVERWSIRSAVSFHASPFCSHDPDCTELRPCVHVHNNLTTFYSSSTLIIYLILVFFSEGKEKTRRNICGPFITPLLIPLFWANLQMHIKADLDVWNSTMGMC
jgi:hypothetical protein